jgi:hypothetical protein
MDGSVCDHLLAGDSPPPCLLTLSPGLQPAGWADILSSHHTHFNPHECPHQCLAVKLVATFLAQYPLRSLLSSDWSSRRNPYNPTSVILGTPFSYMVTTMCTWILFNTSCKQHCARGLQSTIYAKIGETVSNIYVLGVVGSVLVGWLAEGGYQPWRESAITVHKTLFFGNRGLCSKRESAKSKCCSPISEIPDATVSSFFVKSEYSMLQSMQLQNPLLSLAWLVASII